MVRYKILPDKLVRQIKFLLNNNSLSYKDIERILKHEVSFSTVYRIHRSHLYVDVIGVEPPDNYEEYSKVYEFPGKY